MNGHPRHPGTGELAKLRAGATDQAHGERLTAHLAECPDCVSVSERLDQVPLLLASIPPPALPGDVETRIAGALSTEAARRNSSVLSRLRSVSSWPAKGRRRSPVTASLTGIAAAAACLVLAFVGFWLSDTGHRASPPAAQGGAAHPRPDIPVSGMPDMHNANLSPDPFAVIVSTTNFRPSALQAQIARQFAVAGHGGTRIFPSKSLVGCVMRLAGPTAPAFVEEATYQFQPVYVIAVPDHAWVIARDCTPGHPTVLVSVALPPAR